MTRKEPLVTYNKNIIHQLLDGAARLLSFPTAGGTLTIQSGLSASTYLFGQSEVDPEERACSCYIGWMS